MGLREEGVAEAARHGTVVLFGISLKIGDMKDYVGSIESALKARFGAKTGSASGVGLTEQLSKLPSREANRMTAVRRHIVRRPSAALGQERRAHREPASS